MKKYSKFTPFGINFSAAMQFTENFKNQREFVAQLLALEDYKDCSEQQIE
jgi:hypothetical protein